ncbi:hypothetical protein PC116_g23241 [Phytophthora cactorum]|nr:hypothetical protein PC114_g16195 [Phytophthora cactorum]KAG3066497.1 hypothetical protein PC122_g17776 [Phytophthora cactorum]KAG4043139.1 hypothetical protein PC123_g21389 [Phytophthora cactorum]KAG4228407.1 hypothetical protein PC116_g23241 [Phytophthora cactorum]
MSVALPPMRQVTAVPSLLEPAWLWRLAAGILVPSLIRAAVERLATAWLRLPAVRRSPGSWLATRSLTELHVLSVMLWLFAGPELCTVLVSGVVEQHEAHEAVAR